MTKRDEIMREISRALELLGADRELLATFGSWGDSQSDEETLKELREWNVSVRANTPWTDLVAVGLPLSLR